MTLTTPTWVIVCNHKTNTSGANPCTKFDDSIFSCSREILGVSNSKMDHVTRAMPLSEMVNRPKANI